MDTGKYSNSNESLENAMKIFIDYITTVLIMLLSNIAWCNNASLPEDKPITATTGIRTGRVTDAMTGKPIEGAIVVCNWNITEFSMEGGDTESVAIYETITDKDGRYTSLTPLPCQSKCYFRLLRISDDG